MRIFSSIKVFTMKIKLSIIYLYKRIFNYCFWHFHYLKFSQSILKFNFHLSIINYYYLYMYFFSFMFFPFNFILFISSFKLSIIPFFSLRLVFTLPSIFFEIFFTSLSLLLTVFFWIASLATSSKILEGRYRCHKDFISLIYCIHRRFCCSQRQKVKYYWFLSGF